MEDEVRDNKHAHYLLARLQVAGSWGLVLPQSVVMGVLRIWVEVLHGTFGRDVLWDLRTLLVLQATLSVWTLRVPLRSKSCQKDSTGERHRPAKVTDTGLAVHQPIGSRVDANAALQFAAGSCAAGRPVLAVVEPGFGDGRIVPTSWSSRS